MASMPLEIPDNESPEIVSLMEFVIATPGTKYIIAPIIIISKFTPIPKRTVKTENKEVKKAPIKRFTKK